MNSSQTTTQTLTVALIVRDDSPALAQTLQSVAELADEIVVLDTGSADDSLTIAQQAGARVAQHQWTNSFSAARNKCLEQCTSDWVLWLDCGETLSTDDARELKQFVACQAEISQAYMMLVTTPAGPQGEAAEQVGRTRLLPRLPGVQFTGRVRESATQSLRDMGIQTEGLPIRIARGSREHDAELKQRRARRDLVLAEQEVKESGADPRLLLTLGEALRNLGQRLQAAQMFGHALQRSVAGGSEMLEAYYGVLTTLADGTPESLARQVAICLEALEVFPLDAQLLSAMGGFLVQQGNLELGIRSFETAIGHGRVDPTVSHLRETQAVAAMCAAGALAKLGERAKAKAILQQALADNPQCAALQGKLAELESATVEKQVVSSMPWNHAS